MSVVGDCLVPVMCELPRIPARLKLFGSDHVLFGIYLIAVSQRQQWSLQHFVGILERKRLSALTVSPRSHADFQHS